MDDTTVYSDPTTSEPFVTDQQDLTTTAPEDTTVHTQHTELSTTVAPDITTEFHTVATTTEGGLNLGTVIGASVGVLAVVIILTVVIIVLICVCRKKAKLARANKSESTKELNPRSRKISQTASKSRKISTNVAPGFNTIRFAEEKVKQLKSTFGRKQSNISISAQTYDGVTDNPVMGRKYSSTIELSKQDESSLASQYHGTRRETYDNLPDITHAPLPQKQRSQDPVTFTLDGIPDEDEHNTTERTQPQKSITPPRKINNKDPSFLHLPDISQSFLPNGQRSSSKVNSKGSDSFEQVEYANTPEIELNQFVGVDTQAPEQEEYMNMNQVKHVPVEQETYENLGSVQRLDKTDDVEQEMYANNEQILKERSHKPPPLILRQDNLPPPACPSPKIRPHNYINTPHVLPPDAVVHIDAELQPPVHASAHIKPKHHYINTPSANSTPTVKRKGVLDELRQDLEYDSDGEPVHMRADSIRSQRTIPVDRHS